MAKKAIVTKRVNPERHRTPAPALPPPNTEPKAPAPADGHATPAEKDRGRMSFFVSPTADAIRWDDFKSDSGRDTVRTLVQNEAVKMGYVKASDPKAPSDDLIRTVDVFNIINMVNAQGARMTGAPDDAIRLLMFSDVEVGAINKDGRSDRLLAKWLGPTNFKYMDEVIVGLMVVGMSFAKFSAFRAATTKPKQNVTSAAADMDTCQTHGGQFPKGTICPKCLAERSGQPEGSHE